MAHHSGGRIITVVIATQKRGVFKAFIAPVIMFGGAFNQALHGDVECIDRSSQIAAEEIRVSFFYSNLE